MTGVIEPWSEPLGPGIYTAALLAAGVVVMAAGLGAASRRGLPLARTWPCLAMAAAAMIVGARLLHWAIGLAL